MKQERLAEQDYEPVFFYFQEIKTGDNRSWVFEDDEQIRKILEVIHGLEKQTGNHPMKQLDFSSNPEMFVKNLLNTYPDHMEDFCSSLLNNFSGSMLTRAREKGKYAVLILFEESVAICHTDSDTKTITKDRKVIERLLDADNVAKYARFEREDDEVVVHHFERNLSKSFSNWLGVPPEQVAYQDAGDIKVFTAIGDDLVRFEFKQEDFEEKFLGGDDYKLVGSFLITPEGKFPVNHIMFGGERHDTIDEFFQTFYTRFYSLNHHKSLYESVAGTLKPHLGPVIDHEDRVTTGGPNGRIHARKDDSQFNVVYADKTIELSARWRLNLSKQFKNNERVQIHHVGLPLAEVPACIGPFEIHNEVDINDDRLTDLYDITQEAGTGEHLTNIISCIIFYVASRWSPSPLSHFFRQMAEGFEGYLDAEGMILRDEDRIVEFKSRDWVVDVEDEALAQKITEEIQSDAKLLLIGIEEEEQRIRPVNRSRFDPERNNRIRDAVHELNGHHDSINLNSLPLGDGECILFVYSIREDQTFDLDFGAT